MNITELFPALLNTPSNTPRTNPSWTKRGPGRRHNWLTKKQEGMKDRLMRAGATATQALRALDLIV